jgi:membrane protein
MSTETGVQQGFVTDVRRAIATIRDREITFMAASFAHYAFASLIPLLLLALAILSYVGAADALVTVLQKNAPSSLEGVLKRFFRIQSARTVAGGAGLLLTLWSGTKVFRGLSIAFAEIYDTESDLSLVDQTKNAVLILGLFIVAFALLAGTAVALATMNFDVPYPKLLGNLLAAGALVLAFLPMYYVLPPVPVSVRHALPGTLFAAVGWVVLQVAFGYYVQFAGSYAAYGVIGGLLLFVLFLYFGGIVMLVGAAVNVAFDRTTPKATLRTPR